MIQNNNSNTKIKWLRLALLLICISAVGYFVYDAYLERNPAELVIIFPDDEETKIKPEDSGKLLPPNSNNLIYDNLKNIPAHKKNAQTVQLLPEPEKPLNIAGKSDITDQVEALLAGQVESNIHKDAQIQPVDVFDSAEDLMNQDNICDLEAKIAEIDASGGQENSTALEPERQEKSLKVVKVEKSSNLLPANDSKVKGGKVYKLQLASVKTESEGQKEIERLKKKHQKILGKLELQLKKIRHNNGSIFYSVQVGDFASAASAKAACKKLSASGQNCILTN